MRQTLHLLPLPLKNLILAIMSHATMGLLPPPLIASNIQRDPCCFLYFPLLKVNICLLKRLFQNVSVEPKINIADCMLARYTIFFVIISTFRGLIILLRQIHLLFISLASLLFFLLDIIFFMAAYGFFDITNAAVIDIYVIFLKIFFSVAEFFNCLFINFRKILQTLFYTLLL